MQNKFIVSSGKMQKENRLFSLFLGSNQTHVEKIASTCISRLRFPTTNLLSKSDYLELMQQLNHQVSMTFPACLQHFF